MVSLIGGGPGAVDLITVRGLRRIREADCVIYDRLSSPELLREAGADCELIYVGKESRNHTMKQEEINLLLVEKAKQYTNIVRLKGGDPYVFGRGGEEALTLREHGIPFEVVPGISSSIAGLTYAGIPVTHRGVAAGFHVVTAHNKKDELADIDFAAMAGGKDTCVFLMGLSKVEEIAGRLLKAGMSPDTAAAVISQATTCRQRTCVAPLSSIAARVREAALPSPAIIVVGDVVNLREQLNFFEEQKLFGRRYLITKVGKEESRVAKRLRERGAEVVELVTGEIRRRRLSLKKEELSSVDYLVFTSANGVRTFFENLRESGLDARSLADCTVASIGERTSAALEERGICPDIVPERACARALMELLAPRVKPEETLWYVRAKESDDANQEVIKDKCNYKELICYENANLLADGAAEQLLQEGFDGIFFTCASSVRRFFAGRTGCDIPCYSIGEKTTDALHACGVRRIVQAPAANFESLADCAEIK